MLLAALTAALVHCDGRHPTLTLSAEQGSAKTTSACWSISSILPLPAAQAAHDAGLLGAAASDTWIVALDNRSTVPHLLANKLCRAVTGDGECALCTDGDLPRAIVAQPDLAHLRQDQDNVDVQVVPLGKARECQR